MSFNASNQADPVLQGLEERNLFNLAIADQVRNDINVNCHTALDAVSQDLGVEKKYHHCECSEFTPAKTRLLVTKPTSQNTFTPESIQLRVGLVNPTYYSPRKIDQIRKLVQDGIKKTSLNNFPLSIINFPFRKIVCVSILKEFLPKSSELLLSNPYVRLG